MITEARFVDVGGIKTRYFDKGSGEVLFLVHGSHMGTPDACESALDWEFNFDALAARHRVIAMEKLGQGYTDNPKSDADYTMAATVRHAAGLLQTLALRDVHVVGHSRGGYVVARMTLEYPELVCSCTIVDSGTLAPGPSKTEYIMAAAPKPRLSRESQRWCIEHYSHKPDHITRAWLDVAEEIGRSAKYQETVRKMEDEGLKRSQFFPQLAVHKEETLNWIMQGKLTQPTLLVWGYNDPTALLRRGHALFELIADGNPKSEMHIINEAGHFCYREQPEAFNQLVLGFVGRCSR
ncbi:MAG TPA: alpha/beta hydrolase [Candidatus Limnocylindria bacterium]|nr:alpha/beta hydrolase [Candidatus Limnocylindria bacterium]